MTELAVFCSDKIDFRSRQNADLPDNGRQDDDTLPPPHAHFRKLLGKWLFSQFRAIFIFFVFSAKKKFFFLGGGGHVPPAHPPRTPMPTRQFGRDWCVCVCLLQGATVPAVSYLLGRWSPPDERSLLFSIANTGRSS